jgi:hypothetical protein
MTCKGEPKRKGKREEKGHRRAQLISAENNYPFSSNNFLSPTRFLIVKGLINFKKINNP